MLKQTKRKFTVYLFRYAIAEIPSVACVMYRLFLQVRNSNEFFYFPYIIILCHNIFIIALQLIVTDLILVIK